eukprot:70190-Prorocentrum_lima.AAC.1
MVGSTAGPVHRDGVFPCSHMEKGKILDGRGGVVGGGCGGVVVWLGLVEVGLGLGAPLSPPAPLL